MGHHVQSASFTFSTRLKTQKPSFKCVNMRECELKVLNHQVIVDYHVIKMNRWVRANIVSPESVNNGQAGKRTGASIHSSLRMGTIRFYLMETRHLGHRCWMEDIGNPSNQESQWGWF